MIDSAPNVRVDERVAGPAMNVVSAVSIAFLAFFGLIIVALIWADVAYLARKGLSDLHVWDVLLSKEVFAGIQMSVMTSLITLALIVFSAVPIGYALSRHHFFGHALLNAVVDAPIVLPPVVIGLSLLAFFGGGVGESIRDQLKAMDISLISAVGIVMCQYLVSISYCVRAMKVTFDSIDRRLEQVALSLGATPTQVFLRVTLPLAKNGVIAGGVMAWARAIGVFGPLMVFVGTSPRVQVMPTAMWLELSVGNIEASLSLALASTAMACAALIVVHWLAPGRKWS